MSVYLTSTVYCYQISSQDISWDLSSHGYWHDVHLKYSSSTGHLLLFLDGYASLASPRKM